MGETEEPLAPCPAHPGPRLLVSDLHELELCLPLIHGGRAFIELMGPPWLRGQTLEETRKILGSSWTLVELCLDDPAQIPSLLTALKERPSRELTFLEIPWDDEPRARDCLGTLNLHRERLQASGVRALFWVSGGSGLDRLMRLAPDLHSFRDRLIVLNGEASEQTSEPGDQEPRILASRREGLERARSQGDPGALVLAWIVLAEAQMLDGQIYSAEQSMVQARETLGLLPPHYPKRARIESFLLANECRLASRLGRVSAWGLFQRCWRSARLTRDAEITLLLLLSAPLLSGIDISIDFLRELGQASVSGLSLGDEYALYDSIGIVWRARGYHLKAATQRLHSEALPAGGHNRAVALAVLADSREGMGDFTRAQSEREGALRAALEESELFSARNARLQRARLFVAMGELDLAGQILDQVPPCSPLDTLDISRTQVRAELLLQQGRPEEAWQQAELALSQAADLAIPAAFLEAWLGVNELRVEVAEASSSSALRDHLASLERAQEIALALAGSDPPWYRLLFLQMRGRFLLDALKRPDEAVPLLGQAWSVRRGPNEVLAPRSGRLLALAHSRSGKHRKAMGFLEEAEQIAMRQMMLKERLEILVASAEVLQGLNADQDVFKAVLAKIRELCAESGSKVLLADALMQLAQNLPPTFDDPDPLELLGEARRLYLEMPWPARAGRCFEAGITVLRARHAEESRVQSHLRRALALYRKHGLVFREMELLKLSGKNAEFAPNRAPDPAVP